MTRNPPYDRDTALEAAETLFRHKGYHATSLKDLEVALNMRPGSIYAAFKSKENLFLLALDRYARKEQASLACQLEEGQEALQIVQAHIRAIAAEWAAEEFGGCFLVNTLLEVTPEQDTIRDRAQTLAREVQSAFRDTFQHAIDAGELPADTDPAALAQWYQMQVFGLRVLCSMTLNCADIIDAAESVAQSIENKRAA
ncbi:hypothetical protein ACMU_17555 [Actibacterium mucosum KCTC 23349]|uniref:HTH tetR-type domain-containing protein n=1 Tax=Actibacterium mucosum KCTC 23349 TaxID=1454373 RepID=A0A037ZDG7_9RHOB|nr:TetR/AcrR family transcriptional regulator [Actibacterium mucosum]KAJ54514.1 hypothetical protein ACMU_17555 [Actibacterium mucosum KCTC 23349]